ncbi:antiviral helicase [Coccomyxa subellipsoidea C-169]|uniref:Antiviral helicase n=1 Tax=Coccomyxa subellipsoidea (strain C-169) TaxID=574566 RepID=I0YSC2_COCSC|nr:antiviral helicase [Coccomyxa subellipsoidea C-169]EIE21291.1 antiviral helicase [Coccomyxa subellipsoidea C-169]|eukprot:XP_005645835.1 antiviral helicase [Coccomyxa subellipsoidea C-169]
MVKDDRSNKRGRDNSNDVSGPSKQLKLGDVPQYTPEGGSNFIEIDGKTCTHAVAWPEDAKTPNSQPPPARPGPAAKQFPFTLDPFQRTAINCLEAGDSVLVAAHTSAGKTVIAQYCCAMGLRDNQRVIYTSPLKALSNQKYREFHEEFQDVGLMTGDVTINPNASCLVMTTEILRSMLYNGSEIVREAALVVYDEIHYLRDRERGVVWEESIVLAPPTVRFAFLSATIPNALEFAQWIAKTHGSPCHVVYTDYRPTPLQHFVFPTGGDGLFMVVDDRGTFREDNFQKAVAALAETAADGGGKKGGKKGGVNGKKEEESDIFKLVKMIMQRNFDPVIVFSFSKKECEALALQMAPLDLNDEAEQKLVEGIFWNAIDCLSEDDRRLPQVGALLPMLKRGIGVHHSGLLPILKEVIEIMFQENLLKVLFATETFSTGLNMPAKTVVFTNARKFDGGGFRWLSSGEYIQMSGRAGRRGLDDRGIVMLMLDTRMEPAVAKSMVQGAPDTLHSEFHLSHTMLLNLLLSEALEPEALLRQSFRQFQTERSLPALRARIAALQEERDAVVVEEEESVAQYAALLEQQVQCRGDMREIVTRPRYALPFLQPGRLTNGVASTSGRGEGSAVWAAVINFERQGKADAGEAEAKSGSSSKKGARYIVDVLANCAEDSVPGHGPKRRPVLVGARSGGVACVVPVQLGELAAFSSVRIYVPKDLRPPDARTLALKAVGEVERRYPKGLPLLSAEEDMSVDDPAYRKAQRKLENVEGLLSKHSLASAPDLEDRLAAWDRKQALASQVRVAKREAKSAASLILQQELKARRRVLRRLGYVDENGVVTLKGRVAATIQSADELVLTELIFNSGFKDLKPEQAVALVACLVWREKSDAAPRVSEELEGPVAALREAARRVAKVSADSKMGLDVEEYVASFRTDLCDALAAWSKGAKFADIMKMTDVFEGSLVRAVRRVEEVLRQATAGAQVMGELQLVELFEEGQRRIKRDIVFAASLYL